MRRAGLQDEQSGNDTHERHRLKIGEVSKRSGLGIEALRFYERNGLLERPPRTESGYRVYDEAVLERLAFIKQAQALGFSLNEVKRIMDDARAGKSPCDEVREIVRRRLDELDERMREMCRYRAELAKTLEEWDRVGRAPGHICGLIEGTGAGNGQKGKPRSAREKVTGGRRHKARPQGA